MSTKAAGQTSRPALVAPKAAPPKPLMGPSAAAAAAAAATKMHKRSRSGCFTCRLRRKKCDEGKPSCRACKHLGIKCEYKRPLWWSNNEQRKQHKETIKDLIKNTKQSEKEKHAKLGGGDSPPGLTHSLPTSATASDPTGRTRATSEDSSYSFDFNAAPLPVGAYDMYNPQVYTPGFDAAHAAAYYPGPYEIDIQTERQMYVDDVPTRKDSTRSTFSSFAPPPAHSRLATVPEDAWVLDEGFNHPEDLFIEGAEGATDWNFFDFQQPSDAAALQAVVQVDEADRPLLEHFIDNVLRLIFPILEVHQHGSARSEVILPALETNKCYLHCCLSIAAIHLKSTLPIDATNEQLDADIVRHRYATISELCEALNRDTDHMQILQATLGMIFFQCSVGRADDTLPDIPWHQHFQAATSLVRKLDLPALMQAQAAAQAATAVPVHPPFNMTLTAWIDILGATMQGQAPQFANHYREMHLAHGTSGLLELMGCEDRTMYLISEIACLEALKLQHALDDTNLCSHIALLAQQIDATEVPTAQLESAVSAATGAVRPRHLTRNMTALFQRAARIWLISLIPGASRRNPAMLALQQHFAELLALVPTGPGGFDRSIVWPLLMAGAQSTADGPFRAAFLDRVHTMGPAADTGAFGRVRRVLGECWAQENAAVAARGPAAGEEVVCWRDVMRAQGWDFLLI